MMKTTRIAGVVGIGLLAAAGLAGCAEDSAPASAPAERSSEVTEVIDALPEQLKSQYEGATSAVELSPYADFEKVDGPWKVCYADSFQGNAWRVAVSTELERLADQYAEEGLVSGFEVAVAENDVARQSQQIRQFVDQDCSVILTIAASSTGVNEAISYAADNGVPVVTIAGSVTTSDAINVDSNYAVLGADLAKATAEAGPVLMVKGVEGSPIAVQQNDAAHAVWEESGTEIATEVNGDWTPSTTKEAILSAITTNPAEIGAVWSTGSETATIAETFAEAGREAPLITGSISGDALGYWKEHPDEFRFEGVGLLPSWTAQTGFNIAMRVLEGNGPTLSTIMVPVPSIGQDDLEGMYAPCMTPSSTSVFPVAAEDPLPSDLMDAYFTTPGAVGPFDYADTPDACA
jgi:ribose transport system substrate-binding protein